MPDNSNSNDSKWVVDSACFPCHTIFIDVSEYHELLVRIWIAVLNQLNEEILGRKP